MKNVSDLYPLTPTQAGILYHTLRSPQVDVYFQQISCKLFGALDVETFKRAWDEVVARHPALRTIFLWEGVNEPLQVVRQTVVIPWDSFDWIRLTPEEQVARLGSLHQEYRARGFDLTKAPILRMALIRIADDQYHFIWNFHHLLTDGWSTHLVFYEVMDTYETMIKKDQYMPSTVRPFRDYIEWLNRQDMSTAERYWRERLAGFTAPTPFQVDQPAQDEAIEHGESSLALSAETTQVVQEFAKQSHLTLNTIVQGAWSVLLSRYSGNGDVVFGTTLSGRPVDLRGVENMVGMFINTLPVRVHVTEDGQLLPWLQQLQTQQLELRQYEYSPLAKVQRWSEVEPGQPLFESIVVFENYPVHPWNDRSIRIENIRFREQSNYPLALLVIPGEQLRLLMIYNRVRFDADTINRMLNHLQAILSSMVSDPYQTLGALPVMSAAEYHQILVGWNATNVSLGPAVWIHDQFAIAARETPDRIAVTASDGRLTYAELDSRSNQLANQLIRRGIQPGSPIGLYVDRSLGMTVGILGILKTGCAYVPLDPGYPAQRVAFILNDLQASLVVTQPHLADQLGMPDHQYLLLKGKVSQIEAEPEDLPRVHIEPSSLAYIIYTSGSTGMPKGVMVTHENLFHSNAARRLYYGEAVGSYLLLSSFAFDSSVAGIFWTLTDGGTLVLPAPGDEKDVDRLANLIAREYVTHTLALPSLYRLLLEHAPAGTLDTLRTVIVAGEACSPGLGEEHHARVPNAKLYNEYGPTEASVWSSVFQVAGDENQRTVPIGRPIANYKFYVLDRQGRLVPIGLPGELVIGGPGVVPGYWRRPELSAERFTPNPFEEGRVYHTGDRVRWLPDGNLEFIGRVDNQVKLRGYRIELGEIETALLEQPGIAQAVVIVQDDMQPVLDPDDVEALAEALIHADEDGLRLLAALESSPMEQPMVNRKFRRTPDFEIALDVKSDRFIAPPRETQRNWLLNKAVSEFADDLQHLNQIAAQFVPGRAERQIEERGQAELTDDEIMEDWQIPLMEAMAAIATESHGDLLEIGFGRGVSASIIQEMGVRSHTIVECNESVIERFHCWKAGYPDRQIHLLEGRWQDVTGQFKDYDAIFFHTYPLDEDEFRDQALHSATFAEHFFFTASRYLRPGGVFTYLTNEIDSLSRAHQRALLRYFRSFRVQVMPLQLPADVRDAWWANSMVVVRAEK